jgi:hypothetical protein
MLDPHGFARKFGALFLQKADRRLDALLREQGVSAPLDLPPQVAAEFLRRALVETAAVYSPTANLKAMDHGFRSFTHPKFAPAVDRVMGSIDRDQDAFAMAAGVDAAVALAGFGLPVAPFDLKQMRIVGEPSNDIGAVLRLFAGWQSALVGYSACAAPFYVLLTDCLHTLHERVPVCAELAQVKRLFEREGQPVPGENAGPFMPGMGLFRRRHGDRIHTTALLDEAADAGSIILYAGWLAGEKSRGAPNRGYAPVPLQLLRAVVNDPLIAAAVFFPGGARPTMH